MYLAHKIEEAHKIRKRRYDPCPWEIWYVRVGLGIYIYIAIQVVLIHTGPHAVTEASSVETEIAIGMEK